MSKRRIVYIVLGALALSGSVRADLGPVSAPDAGVAPPMNASMAILAQDADPSHLLSCLSTADLGSPGETSWPDLADDVAPTAAGTTAPHIQSDGQSSFGLCLYALLGLGVCRSVPLVRKFSFTYIPQWYHDGGPFQIGHSHAIAPDCLCDGPVYCLVQPDGIASNSIPRYHFRAVVSRWRNSQFTPAVLASRAPPLRSC